MIGKNHIGGERHGNKTEEDKYQHVAQAEIREERGIEKGKEDTGRPYADHFPATVEDKRETGHTGKKRCDGHSCTHRRECYPAFRAGPLRPQPGGPVIIPPHTVKIVIDEV